MNAGDSIRQPVWQDLDQDALDRAYDQAQHAPNMQDVLKRYEIASERTRARLGVPSRHPYGRGAHEVLDCFLPERRAGLVPAVIFIHGGAWRGGSASQYAFVADALVDSGCAVLIADFAPVTDLDGDLVAMAEQIRRAVAWVADHAESLGLDPSRIHLVGHSSGAHLAAVAAGSGWREAQRQRPSPIASLTLCSGLYDLKPVRLSARSRYLSLDDESEALLSPIRHLTRMAVPVTVAWGDRESPEFQRQSREFAEAAQAAGCSVQTMVASACNHFEILETLASPHGLLGEAVLSRIRVPGPTDASAIPATASPQDEHWMRLALAESQRAYERGDWPTGAVIVRDGRLLSTGQNRQVTLGDLTLHAETEAIRSALAKEGISATQGATLYCTMEPCPMCAGALKLAGITRVVLALRHATLRRTDLGSYGLEPFFEMTDWTPELKSGILEGEYLALRRRWGRDPVRPADT
jgi:arylformamidase